MLNINDIQDNAMIHTNDHKTIYLFDPWSYLGPKRRKLLEESWAGTFREHILPALPVRELARHFSTDMGRPTKELFTSLGVLILQQMNNLTDNDTVDQLAFNTKWHYALDISGESDEAKYISPKTLWNIRDLVTSHNLETVLFNQTTDTLAKAFQVDTSKQRLDSVHICSNMRRLGRIGIFVRSIHTFLVNLKRQHGEILGTLETEVVERYLPEKALSCFSLVKPSESYKTLRQVSGDLLDLIRRFQDRPEVTSLHSYHTLLRVFKEQCTITEGSDEQPLEFSLKTPKEISSDSLQNPSDPDATYDGHKGQGYQAQVMETYCDHEDEEIKGKTLNLITHVAVETACASDVHALIPAIESTKERGLEPEEVLADSLYGSDENSAAAKEMGVDVVSPVMGSSREDKIPLSDFQQSDKGKIVACPQGCAPVKIKAKNHRNNVAFDSTCCNQCPQVGACPVKPGRKYHYLRYDDKALRSAARRVKEQTDEFKKRYRWRSGIEATMSYWDRKMEVKQLRVRGMGAVRFAVVLKAIGINILRATAVLIAIGLLGQGAFTYVHTVLGQIILVFKEQFGTRWAQLSEILAPLPHTCDFEHKIPA